MTDRRTFFATAAVAAAASTMASDARATGRTPLSFSADSVKSLQTMRREIATALPAEDQAVRQWLARFEPGLDAESLDCIKQAGDRWRDHLKTLRHLLDPLLVEDHLNAAARLLDQALAYRGDLAALEVSGFQTGMRYLASLQSLAIAEQLIPVTSSARGAGQIATAYERARAREKKESADLERTVGQIDAARTLEGNEVLREKLSRDQLVVARNALAAERAELLQIGGANNFAERYTRLMALYRDDLQEAYLRCVAAALGINARYRSALVEMPVIDANTPADQVGRVFDPALGPLDTLVRWVRDTVRKLDSQARDEFNTTVVLSIRQAMRKQFPGATANADADWINTLAAAGKGVFTFKVDDDDLRELLIPGSIDLRNARVLGVGLQYVTESKATPGLFQASVLPPTQTLLDGAAVTRLPMVLGAIDSVNSRPEVGPRPLQFETDDSILNSPAVGTWEVRVRREGLPLAGIANGVRPRSEITDLLLALRVRVKAARTG